MPRFVVDIDGTLISGGKPVPRVINWCEANSDEIDILTNRPESERESAKSDLSDAGVTYNRLIMNDTGEPAPRFKSAVISKMLSNGERVDLFVDNDPDNRAAVSRLGVKTKDPATIPAEPETSSMASLKPRAQGEVERLDRESAFYSRPTFMEHSTIEETLAAVQASLSEAVAMRDEVAAKAVEASESFKLQLAERDTKVAELTVALEAANKLAAELTEKVAALESKTISASEQAAVIAASVGVDPVEVPSAEQTDNSPEAIRQKFLSMPAGRERQAFFNANRKTILGR